MIRQVYFEEPGIGYNLYQQEKVMGSILKRVRVLAAERGVKVPKTISYGGCSEYVYVTCPYKGMGEIVTEVLKKRKKKVFDKSPWNPVS